MKYLGRSSSEGNGTVHQFDPREQHTQENEKKERDEEEDRGSKVAESTERVSELPEEYFHGLEDLPWNLTSLEQTVYLSLPVWVQAALLCNLAGQYGVWTFHNNFLPCHLISYLFLPYTLPATLMVSFSYRLLCWTRQIVQKAVSVLTGVTLWAMELFSTFSLFHFRRHLLDRNNHSPANTGSSSSHSSALSVSNSLPPTTSLFNPPNLQPLPSSSTLN